MATDSALSFSVASVMEDVLQQHDKRPRDLDFDSRRAEEAGMSVIVFFFFCNLFIIVFSFGLCL